MKFCLCHPRDGDVLMRVRRNAGWHESADEGNHLDQDGAVIVRKSRQAADHGDPTTEFFFDLSDQCHFRRLARLDFSTGKFPHEAEVFVARPLRQKETVGLVDDDRADNRDGGRRAHEHSKRPIRAVRCNLWPAAGFCRQMKTFLKAVVLIIAAIIAVKLLPLTLGLGFALGLALVALAAVGVSVVALLLGLVVLIVAVLAPVWMPILAMVGLIALIRRGGDRRVAG